MTTTVPSIDLSPFRTGGESSREEVVSKVKLACEEIGFFLVTGHGVPETLVDQAYRSGADFFDLPESSKNRSIKPSPQINRGYTAMKSRTVGRVNDPTLLPSLQEGFAMGMMDVPSEPYFHSAGAGANFAQNIWPPEPPGFEQAMREYYRAMEGVSETIMRIFALALDLPERYFEDKMDRHISTLRLVNYPELKAAPDKGEERAGAHTDTGTLTILRIDDAPGGLQVCTRAGDWIDVKRVPGAFIINIGDMMMRWTNDHWISTLHRVVNPDEDKRGAARRLSIVYFSQPNYDTVIQCIPTCCSAEDPARYEPITSGAHRLARYSQTYNFELPKAG